MGKLSENWLTESHIDFELKKYTLLAYLQEVKEQYRSNKLYPSLAELIEHYKNLLTIKQSTEKVKDNFAKDLSGFDITAWKAKYSGSFEEDEAILVVQEIINYSLPLFAENIHEGRSIYDLVEEHLKIEAVGISPVKTNEGYLLLHCKEEKNIHAYQYAVSLYESAEEKYRSISTHYISDYSCSISRTFESIKSDLISKNRDIPNPAVYAVNCNLSIPLQETFLPVAKRYFVGKMGF
ncbi:MAG: hypothetical protein K0S33_820 [Bacteroidetes bacterium]|jgi:hypothetical protein|nr:hypothetical protein [Bacteroidota bacterium]